MAKMPMKGGTVQKMVPTPKSVYKTTAKKPEPDNYPAKPKAGRSNAAITRRLKGVPI